MKRDLSRLAWLVAVAIAVSAPSLALAQQQAADPPTRVGRLAKVSGTVSFHTADQDQWTRASLNYPVTGGSSFWTEPKAKAVIEVGANRLYLDQSTELDLTTLSEESLVATVPQGGVYLSLTVASSNDQYEIDTPRGTVNLSEAGGYEIVAGDADNPTVVAVSQGTAEFVVGTVHLSIGPRQSATIWGSDQIYIATGPAQDDDFIRAVKVQEQPYLAQNRPPPPPATRQPAPPASNQQAGRPPAPPPQSADNQPPPDEGPGYAAAGMTGYQDLDRYGAWRDTQTYGQVWFPRVHPGWAPYREGHWAYVQPWGWTWIDDAPWGFTPFHYGRWVEIDRQWAWTPGRAVERPVYAPAVVNFLGGAAVGASSQTNGSPPAVGWVPLGPQEVYVPPYRTTPDYVRNLNANNVRDVNRINEATRITNQTNTTTNVTTINRTVVNNYVNQSAVTVVPTTTMTGSRPVAQASREIAPAQLDKAVTVGAAPPVMPTLATAGMTPTLARKIGADTAPVPGTTAAPAAPGPAVTNFLGRKPRLRNPPQVAMGEPPAVVPAQPGAVGVQAPPQNGQPPKQAPAVTEVPPVAAEPGKAGAPASTIPPEAPPPAGADQAGKPGKPGKRPPAAAQTEVPPAAGETGQAGAPGPAIPPKTPPAAGADQGGKPAGQKPVATAGTEAPPAAGEANKAGAPGPAIPPKTPPAAGADQGGKPAGQKPVATAGTEAPPAAGEANKAGAPGPAIPPKTPPAAGADQGGKPAGQKPVATAGTEAPPAAGEANKAGAPGPTIPPKTTPVAGAGQAGKPAGQKPVATAQTEAPPAAGGAPGPAIPPQNPPAAGPDQSGKPGKPGKPPVVAANEPPPGEAAPGPQVPEKKPGQEGGQLAQGGEAGQGGCRIKGNIRGGERLYLMPGERGYDQVKIEKKKGERMFCSEAEAQAAGWRHANP